MIDPNTAPVVEYIYSMAEEGLGLHRDVYKRQVCDDEKSDLDGIVQSVQQYDVQGCFDIETYMDGNELLSELQMQKKSFDLLLLDIEMPSNGFQLAQSLIQMEKHPLVVFVTKRHEYAVQRCV